MVLRHDLHRRSTGISVATVAGPCERIALLPFLPKDIVEQMRWRNLGKRLELKAGRHVGLHVLVAEALAHVVLGQREAPQLLKLAIDVVGSLAFL